MVSFYSITSIHLINFKIRKVIEVLDDFRSETKEVHKYNPWLNYNLALHRCRELGYNRRIFDLLDERRLKKGELREFCFLLFGRGEFDSVPDPDVDWDGFCKALSVLVGREKKQWNSTYKKPKKVLHMKVLYDQYSEKPCHIM